MANVIGFADAVIDAVLSAVEPLKLASQDQAELFEILSDLGWTPPEGDIPGGSLSTLSDIASALDTIEQALEMYQNSGSPDPTALENLIKSTVALVGLIDALRHQTTDGLPAPLSLSTFWQRMAEELPAFLAAKYFRHEHPLIYGLFRLSGVLDLEPAPSDVGRVDGQIVDRLHWDRLAALLSNPNQLVIDIFKWGISLDYVSILNRLRDWIAGAGVTCFLVEPSQEQVDVHYGSNFQLPADVSQLRIALFIKDDDPYVETGLELFPVPSSTDGIPQGFVITPYAAGVLTSNTRINDVLSLSFTGTIDGTGDTGVKILPGSVSAFTNGVGLASDLTMFLNYTPVAPEQVPAQSGESGVSFDSAELGGELYVAGLQQPEALIRINANQLALRLNLGDGDGFISSVAENTKGEVALDIALIWSNKRGLIFEGGSGLQITRPMTVNIGPLALSAITFSVNAIQPPAEFDAGVDATLQLGPFVAFLRNVGLRLRLDFGNEGEFFGLKPRFAFKPPDGVGLSLDAGVVAGGGYLFVDEEKGQYAGAIQLELESLSLAALGLLNTKLPDGSPILNSDGTPGYSLLIIITATFPPIQIGFGFALNGVGGLLGLNRTMNLDALRAGVRNRAIDSALMPTDPLDHATQLVTSLSNLFPVAVGRFLVGPMVRLSWGTPALMMFDLAVLVEVPPPLKVAVLGRIRLALPEDDDFAVVVIQLDVLGVIDFDQGTVSIDATIYDSMIAGFALSGDMALRAGWKDNPQFALALGGFHPNYQPPVGFPSLNRLTLSLCSDSNPRLRLEAYLAVTSNSVQFGARVDLHAEEAGFTIDGVETFDALIHLKPFGLIIDFAGAVAVRYQEKVICSVTVSVHLVGPGPWVVSGKASFSVLFISGSVSFKASIGQGAPAPTPSAVDVSALLAQAITTTANWTAQPPVGEGVITLRSLPANGNIWQANSYYAIGERLQPALDVNPGGYVFTVTTGGKSGASQPGWPQTPGAIVPDGQVAWTNGSGIRAHPLGALTFRQRIVPFGVTLDKYGDAPVLGATEFAITSVQLGSSSQTGSQATITPVNDEFAPGEFKNLSDADELSLPSFEPFQSGFTASFDTPDFDDEPQSNAEALEYQLILVDSVPTSGPATATVAPATAVRMAATSPAAFAPNRHVGARRFTGPSLNIQVLDRKYAVTDALDASKDPVRTTSSWTQAAQIVRASMALSQRLQVVRK